ncbi:MAG: tetratricopeptide repeat protein [Thermoleophilia bacterium]
MQENPHNPGDGFEERAGHPDQGAGPEPGRFQLSGAKATAMAMGLISLAAALVYSNTYKVPFVFDDVNVYNNVAIHSFHNLLAADNHQRILGLFSFFLNYRLSGFNLSSFHLVNLAIHVAASLLVFAFVRMTFRTPFFRRFIDSSSSAANVAFVVALFSALIFAVHPVQTQAVTYIVQRYASMVAMFYLLAAVLYARWRLALPSGTEAGASRARRAFFYGAALLAAVAAMASKETAFTLPAALALWEFFFMSGTGRGLRKRIAGLLPFAATTILIPLSLLVSNISLLSATGGAPPPPAVDYLMTQFRVIVTYLRLLVFPVNQNLDYDYPVYHSLADPNVFLSLAFLLAIVAGGVYLLRRSGRSAASAPLRLIAFGIFWFFLTLSVESSIIPIEDVIFEHRLYLPSMGLFVAAATALTAGAAYLKPRLPVLGKAAIPALTLVVLVFGGLAYARNAVWHNTLSLWTDTVSKSPGKARVHNALGVALMSDAGDNNRARTEFEIAVALYPGYYGAYYNLGRVDDQAGQIDKAMAEYKAAVTLDPNFVNAHNDLGVMYAEKKQFDQAIAEFQKAVQLQPDFVEAYNNMGLAYNAMNKPELALTAFTKATDGDSHYAGAFLNAGRTEIKLGRYQNAVETLKTAVALAPQNPSAYDALGRAYQAMGSAGQAADTYRQALKLNSRDEDAGSGLKLLGG